MNDINADAMKAMLDFGIEKSLNVIADDAWRIAEAAGWHGKASTVEQLALIHSEVSEALEAWRTSGIRAWTEVDGKPEGFAAELADVIIKVFDTLIQVGVNDIESLVKQKMAYNRRRTDVPARSDNAKAI